MGQRSSYMDWTHCVLLLVTGALSCSSTTQPVVTDTFPNSIGSRWVYSVYDSLTQKRDTVEVQVAEQTQVILDGELRTATRWRLTPALNDSIWYVIISGDTVRVLIGDLERALAYRFMYVFPLEVGSRWDVPTPCVDSTEVVAREEVADPDGGERMAYFLRSMGFCYNNFQKEESWFVPGVGLLSWNRWAWEGFVTRNKTWELIAYQIKSD